MTWFIFADPNPSDSPETEDWALLDELEQGGESRRPSTGDPPRFQHRNLSRYQDRDDIAPFTRRWTRIYRAPSHLQTCRRPRMLPASDIAEILTNLSALNLQPTATAQILAAVLAPLLRSTDPDPPALPPQRAERPRVRPWRAARHKK